MSDMSRTEAISILKKLKLDAEEYGKESDFVKQAVEAFDFAIASLETDEAYQLEYERTTKNCESCRYYGLHHEVCNYCYKCSLWTEQEPTTKNDLGVDAVRRKAVLNTLDNMDSALDDEDRTVETYKELLKECYKVLPSVTPQPRKGHWVSSNGVNYTYFNSFIVCSECGVHPEKPYNFCPYCGADMREVEE